MAETNDETVRVVLRVCHRVDDPTRDCLAVIGSVQSLGCWDTSDALVADYIGLSTWQCAGRLPKYQTIFWKWIVMNRNTQNVTQRESCNNRTLDIDDKSLIVTSDWSCKETIIVVDPSIHETLRAQAESALKSYLKKEDKKRHFNKGRVHVE